jgi:myb proto-oncogene protein
MNLTQIRVKKRTNKRITRGAWNETEDALLIECVEKYGTNNWTSVSTHIPNRIGKQCRARWHNHLDPTVKKDWWTKEEDVVREFLTDFR